MRGARAARQHSGEQSGGYVRNQLNLQLKDLILDLQFLLLQAPQLEFVMASQRGESVDHVIEIAMLDLQFDDAAMDRLFIHMNHRFLKGASVTHAIMREDIL